MDAINSRWKKVADDEGYRIDIMGCDVPPIDPSWQTVPSKTDPPIYPDGVIPTGYFEFYKRTVCRTILSSHKHSHHKQDDPSTFYELKSAVVR